VRVAPGSRKDKYVVGVKFTVCRGDSWQTLQEFEKQRLREEESQESQVEAVRKKRLAAGLPDPLEQPSKPGAQEATPAPEASEAKPEIKAVRRPAAKARTESELVTQEMAERLGLSGEAYSVAEKKNRKVIKAKGNALFRRGDMAVKADDIQLAVAREDMTLKRLIARGRVIVGARGQVEHAAEADIRFSMVEGHLTAKVRTRQDDDQPPATGFACRACGAELDAPPTGQDAEVTCPSCNTVTILIGEAQPIPVEQRSAPRFPIPGCTLAYSVSADDDGPSPEPSGEHPVVDLNVDDGVLGFLGQSPIDAGAPLRFWIRFPDGPRLEIEGRAASCERLTEATSPDLGEWSYQVGVDLLVHRGTRSALEVLKQEFIDRKGEAEPSAEQ